jgi:hypothetical protein
MSLRASMLCNTTIIRYLNKPTQSKTQLTQEVVNSFNTYYTQGKKILDNRGRKMRDARESRYEMIDARCEEKQMLDTRF